MSIGAGIAIAGVWIAAAYMATDHATTGVGMVFALIAALVSTGLIASVKP